MPLDEEQFIGSRYQDDGYVTMMAEDSVINGVFSHQDCVRFTKTLLDHFMKPFQLQEFTDDLKKIIRNHYLLSYLKNFLKAYPNKPKFSMSWMNFLAHTYRHTLSSSDIFFTISSRIQEMIHQCRKEMLYKHRIQRYLILLGFLLTFLFVLKGFISPKKGSILSLFFSSNSHNQMSSYLQMQNRPVKIIEFRILTAFSADHFDEALRSCKLIGNLNETQNWKPGYMTAYILKDDISRDQYEQYLIECPFVTLRIFDASKYPDFVSQNSYEFRWKPLIVYEVMKEVEKVFWVDSSVIFKNDANESITDIVSKMDTKFVQCGVRLFGDAGHSIFYATHPKMLQYFNVSEDTAKKNLMIAATYFIISKKNGMDILEKWKNCALKKECMAPKGHQLYCKCETCFEKNIYGRCHRYDQSALSILAYKCSSNSSDFLELSSMLETKRMNSLCLFYFCLW